MDYAAALRKAPGSESTPAPAQASPKPQQKKPQPREKVAVEQPAVDQGEAARQASSAGSEVSGPLISPIVRFEIYVPEIDSKDIATNDDDDSLAAEADEGDDAETTDAATDTKKPAPKATGGDSDSRMFSVQQIATKRNRANELATYLLKKIDDKSFDIQGGFRFFAKVGQKGNNSQFTSKPIPELDLDSLPQALRWVQAVTDILNNKVPSAIACGHNSFIGMTRHGESLRVVRTYGDDNNRKAQFVFKLEDFALRVREQAKTFVKAAQQVEDIIARKDRDNAANKTKGIRIAEKMNRIGFNSASKELKKLFATTSALPKLSQKFQKQQQKKTLGKKQLQNEYKAMKQLVLELVPKAFMERDIASLVPKEDEEPEVVVEAKPVEKPAAETKKSEPAAKKGNNNNNAAANQADKQQGKSDTPSQERRKFEPKDDEKKGLQFTANPYDLGDTEVNVDAFNSDAVRTGKATSKADVKAAVQVKQQDTKHKKQDSGSKPAPAAKQQQQQAAAATKKQDKPKPAEPQQSKPKQAEKPKQAPKAQQGSHKAALKTKAATREQPAPEAQSSSLPVLIMLLVLLGGAVYVYLNHFDKLKAALV